MKINLRLLLPLAWLLSKLIDINRPYYFFMQFTLIKKNKTCSNNIWYLLLMSRNNECEILCVERGCAFRQCRNIVCN
jgi:hypothetical protein